MNYANEKQGQACDDFLRGTWNSINVKWACCLFTSYKKISLCESYCYRCK